VRMPWKRMLAVFRGRRLERDLAAEINAHLAMQEQEFRDRGLDPAAAHAAALRAFGGVTQAMEDYREGQGLPWIETTARDARYALRGLRQNPGFAAAAVLSLALGIGANTAIFSLFQALMLRMLPVDRPQELVSLYKTGGWGKGFVSYPLFQEIAKRTDLFTGVIGRTGVEKVRFTHRPGGREEFTQREFVTGNYFSALGVAPALGRLFTDDDNRTPGAHPVAVLSYDLWRRQYAANPAVLGSKILVDQQPFTVIGVAAAGFHGVEFERRAEVWVPAMMAGAPVTSPNYWWIWVVARRRPEVSPRQVQAALDVFVANYLRTLYPSGYNAAFRKRALEQRLEVRDGAVGISALRSEFGLPLAVLMAAVVLVLLAACANVANLLLARGAARRKEIAMRLSLGATRARLVRQAITESVLLMVAGGALGIWLATWGQGLVIRFIPEQAGNPFGDTLDGSVLLFTLAISAASVLLFALAPALRSTAVDPAGGLRSGSSIHPGAPVLRRVLVVAQVAFSVVLLALAALFSHNLVSLRGVDLGFHNRDVVELSVDFPRQWKGDLRTAIRQIADELGAQRGVASVSYGFPGPFLSGTSSASIRVPGSERTAHEPVDVETAHIAPRYFETIGAPLVMGREFEPADRTSARKVAVVSEAFVRAFFPGEKHPDSRTLSFDDSKPEGGEVTYIVGVVRDIRQAGIQKTPKPTVYVAIDQDKNAGNPEILLRTEAPPRALLGPIYRSFERIGGSVAIGELRTLRQQVDESIFEQRLLAALGGFFGSLALVLSGIGLYGVVAYGAARRTGEIGLRIALGARRAQVVWMILRDSLLLVAIGLALGLPAALAAARTVESILFGIPPEDPLTFASTAAILAAIALGAAFLPARRAATMEPSRVLRHE
jgi:predicted permease